MEKVTLYCHYIWGRKNVLHLVVCLSIEYESWNLILTTSFSLDPWDLRLNDKILISLVKRFFIFNQAILDYLCTFKIWKSRAKYSKVPTKMTSITKSIIRHKAVFKKNYTPSMEDCFQSFILEGSISQGRNRDCIWSEGRCFCWFYSRSTSRTVRRICWCMAFNVSKMFLIQLQIMIVYLQPREQQKQTQRKCLCLKNLILTN